MVRFWLRDDQFVRIEAVLPGKRSDPGRTAANNRLFLEAVLWIARTGSPWRDLPTEFGLWNIPRSSRCVQREFDKHRYESRDLVERFFCRIKQFRRIATRYDRIAQRFSFFVAFTASVIWLA